MIQYAFNPAYGGAVTAPVCAACLEPIGSKGALKGKAIGTEVFHHKCVLAGGVERSLLRRTQAQVRDAQNQNARSRHIEEDTLEVLRKEQDEVFRLRKQVRELNAELLGARRDLAVIREEDILLTAQLAAATRERDAARREAALHQALGPAVAAPARAAIAAEEQTINVEPEDGTKKRFEMLELD